MENKSMIEIIKAYINYAGGSIDLECWDMAVLLCIMSGKSVPKWDYEKVKELGKLPFGEGNFIREIAEDYIIVGDDIDDLICLHYEDISNERLEVILKYLIKISV